MKINIGPYPETYPAERVVDITIDRYDSWNADHTLALIIHPVLKQLLETKIGSGFVDDEDVPEEIRSSAAPPKEHEWDADIFWHERSRYVLSEMVWAFEQIVKGNAKEELDENGEFVGYRTESDPHFQRVCNGLRLFAKYYFSLWD